MLVIGALASGGWRSGVVASDFGVHGTSWLDGSRAARMVGVAVNASKLDGWPEAGGANACQRCEQSSLHDSLN